MMDNFSRLKNVGCLNNRRLSVFALYFLPSQGDKKLIGLYFRIMLDRFKMAAAFKLIA